MLAHDLVAVRARELMEKFAAGGFQPNPARGLMVGTAGMLAGVGSIEGSPSVAFTSAIFTLATGVAPAACSVAALAVERVVPVTS